jgi:hypothetical protein
LNRYDAQAGLGGDVRRREFITLLSGAAVWPITAHAQQAERIGVSAC